MFKIDRTFAILASEIPRKIKSREVRSNLRLSTNSDGNREEARMFPHRREGDMGYAQVGSILCGFLGVRNNELNITWSWGIFPDLVTELARET
jgi:hypothetical protein